MSVSDSTQREEMETALRESEQRFRDYAEMASDWFWATGPEHEFTYFSEQVGAFGDGAYNQAGLGKAAS